MKILKITKFKIVFLLPFTSCRKVLGKMPAFFAKLANNFFFDKWKFFPCLNQFSMSYAEKYKKNS